MLTIFGQQENARQRSCDRLSRRNFLTIGGMGALAGLTLPGLLAAEAKSGVGRSHKAIINVFLPGGPPHQDMWDIKEDAPAEIRGEFKAIDTNVPGIRISEMFPRIAGMMDKFVPIRSMVGSSGGHDAFGAMTGRKKQNAPAGGWPSLGAWVSKTLGPVGLSTPAHVSLFYKTSHQPWGDPGDGGFLGMKHGPFRLVGGKDGGSSVDNMVLKGMSLERLSDRSNLRASLDRFKSDVDSTGMMDGVDAFTQQAMGILTSSNLAEALDYTQEDAKTIERYGKGDPTFRADGAPKMTENFLVARRLVEAGARVVSLNFSRWDWHGKNFDRGRQDMPMLDQALSALVEDLDQRGMLDDVSIVCWGEFGRTPKINKNGGRDHWPQVSCALMAGGGIRAGQVIGSTNRLGERADDRPVTFPEVAATLLTNVGMNLRAVREFDLRGRPYYPIDPGVEPLRELV